MHCHTLFINVCCIAYLYTHISRPTSGSVKHCLHIQWTRAISSCLLLHTHDMLTHVNANVHDVLQQLPSAVVLPVLMAMNLLWYQSYIREQVVSLRADSSQSSIHIMPVMGRVVNERH